MWEFHLSTKNQGGFRMEAAKVVGTVKLDSEKLAEQKRVAENRRLRAEWREACRPFANIREMVAKSTSRG